MVRTSVRAITLNVYGLEVPATRAFVLRSSESPYFLNLVRLLAPLTAE